MMGLSRVSYSSTTIYGQPFDLEQVLIDRKESLLVANGQEWKQFLLGSNKKRFFQCFWFCLVDLETYEGKSEAFATFLAEILSCQKGKLPFDLTLQWVPFVARFSRETIVRITQKLHVLREPLIRESQWLDILFHFPEEALSKVFLKDKKSQLVFFELWDSIRITGNTQLYHMARRYAFDSIPSMIRQHPNFSPWYKKIGVRYIDLFMIDREKLVSFSNHPLYLLFQHLISLKNQFGNQFFNAFKDKYLSGISNTIIFSSSPIIALQIECSHAIVQTFSRHQLTANVSE